MKVVRVLFVAVSTLVAGAALQAQPPTTPPTILHRFSAQLRAGMAPLTGAPDGRLFGVMEQGGLRDQGAVYVLTPDGNGGYAFSPLWWFDGFNGRKPTGLTYSAVDDKLYGTTSEGGVNGSIYDGMGTVFSLNSDGTGFAKLIDFDLAFSPPQPGHPQAGLLEASDGYFYGTGSSSSTGIGAGAIFRMDRTGAYDVIWTFSGTDGGTPQSKLVEGTDGFLYGTTTFGGASNAGTVFKIDKAGAALTTLHQFTGPAATQPRGLLLDTSSGSDVFYGLTGGGGTDELGSVFSITPSGTFATIASFTMTPGFFWATQGAYPNGALVKGSNGLLYGTTESAGPIPFGSLGVVFSVDPASGEIVVVHNYTSDPGTGFLTNAGLTVAADGTLVGTTWNGGAHRVGTAYRVDISAASPVVSKIADFPSQGPSSPQHRLFRASDGFLYGTTQSGGDFNSGTIFRYANGVGTAIHDFNFADGHQPSGELVEGSDGFLYGTTPYGGNVLFPGDFGGGTIYRIAKDGSGFTVVHRFSDYATEGAYPLAGLVEGPDGNFYGTTHQNGPGGAGTVFKVTPSGTLTTLHAFNVWSSTTGTLVIGEDGYFYGVTREGGSTPTGGTIYKIDSEGNFVLLHEFVNIADGAHPNALALGTDGNLYGTTEHGGTFFGTLFRITSTGVFTVLHRFDRDVDGSDPMSAPFEAGDGNFYGSAWFGGRVAPFVSGIGTVYRYDGGGVQLLHTFDGREFGEISPVAGLTQGSDNRLYGALMDPAGGALYAIAPGITNKAPIVRQQRLSIAPGQLQTINLTALDPDGDPLTFTIVGQPAHGTVNGSGPAYQYQPTPGFSGTDYFYVRANDGTVSSAVAGVMINVGTANTPPVAYDGIFTTAEDFSVSTFMTTFDAEQNPLSFTVVTPPAHGTLSGAAPDFIYNPAPNYNGPDSFTFKVNDGTADSNVATISITVDPVNDAPVASDQSLASNASAPVPLVLSAVDVDGDALSYHIVDDPQHGVLTGSAPNLTYTPETGFSGTDTFTFYAHDGSVAGNVATVTIAVTANHAPVAQDQSVTVPYETATPIDLVATDADGDPLTWLNFALPQHGALSGTAPNYIYTPANGYSGPDSFTFKVNDGKADSNLATVTITVGLPNRPPVAVPGGPYTTDVGAQVTFDGSGSSDPDGDALVQYLWTSNGQTIGMGSPLTVSASVFGAGLHTLTLRVTDATGRTATADTTVTVRTPTASFTAAPNPGACGQAIAYDGSGSNDRPGRSIVTYAWAFGDGATAAGPSASHVYSQFGAYLTTLTVTDDLGITASSSRTININQGNAPPVANPGGPYATTAGTSITLDGSGSSDPNAGCGDTVVSAAWLVNGTITLTGFAPALTPAQTIALGPGVFPVQLTVTDSFGVAGTASTTLTIQPASIGTTTTLQTSANVVGMLQPVTLTATVSAASGSGVPTGQVMFVLNGSIMVGLVPLVNGVATLHVNGGVTPAVSSITAHYPGVGGFASSSSAPVSITTLQGSASSFTVLLPWTNPQALGSPVTVSAFVLALGTAPAPTGTVEFYDGAALVGTAPLSSGLATVSFLPSIGGTHTLSAKYLGSGTFAGSTAPPAQITVYSGATPAATTTALTVTPNPAQTFAQPVTFTATVSGAVTGGTVTFFMDGVVAGTAPVLNVGGTMQATLSLQDVALGTRVVSASYGGAPGFAASNSALLLLTARP